VGEAEPARCRACCAEGECALDCEWCGLLPPELPPVLLLLMLLLVLPLLG
jgi:hypothetical protein